MAGSFVVSQAPVAPATDGTDAMTTHTAATMDVRPTILNVPPVIDVELPT
jgi:hypothetical protein